MLERGAVEGEVFHRGAVQALAPDETAGDAAADRARAQGADPARPAAAAPARTPSASSTCSSATPPTTRSRRRPAPTCTSASPTGSTSTATAIVELDELARLPPRAGLPLPRRARPPSTTRPARSASGRRAGSPPPGCRAHARGDLGAAANLLGRAAALLPAESRERIEVVLALVEPLAALMRVAEVETLLDQAAPGRGAPRRRAPHRASERGEGMGRRSRDGRAVVGERGARRRSSEAIAVFERLGDDVALARALEVVAIVHLYYGRLSEVAAASERGYHHAERAHAREAAGEASPRPEGRRPVGHDPVRPDRRSARGGSRLGAADGEPRGRGAARR